MNSDEAWVHEEFDKLYPGNRFHIDDKRHFLIPHKERQYKEEAKERVRMAPILKEIEDKRIEESHDWNFKLLKCWKCDMSEREVTLRQVRREPRKCSEVI